MKNLIKKYNKKIKGDEMKHKFFFTITATFLICLFSFAFAKKKIDTSSWKTYEDKILNLSFKHPITWSVFTDKKKISLTFSKDYLLIKKKSGFAHIRVHLIKISSKNYKLKLRKFRDSVFRDRIRKMKRYRGVINRNLNSEETKTFRCEKGKVISYIYNDQFNFTNQVYLYFFKKGFELFVFEAYTEKVIKDNRKYITTTVKVEDFSNLIIKEIISSIRLK